MDRHLDRGRGVSAVVIARLEGLYVQREEQRRAYQGAAPDQPGRASRSLEGAINRLLEEDGRRGDPPAGLDVGRPSRPIDREDTI